MTYTGCPEFERDRSNVVVLIHRLAICLREDGNVELVVFVLALNSHSIKIRVYLLNNLFLILSNMFRFNER